VKDSTKHVEAVKALAAKVGAKIEVW